MRRRVGGEGEKPAGTRWRLVDKFSIDDAAMESSLLAAIKQQRERDELLSVYARRARDLSSVADNLRKRRSQLRHSLAQVAGEIAEAPFDEQFKQPLIARMRYLLDALYPHLLIRIYAIQTLAAVARLGRSRGRASTSIVDACLQSCVDQLVNRVDRPLRREQALEYVAALAQVHHLLSAGRGDPIGGLRARLKRLKRRTSSVDDLSSLNATALTQLRVQLAKVRVLDWPKPDATLADLMQQLDLIARADWPASLRLPSVDLASGQPVRRPLITSDVERFYLTEQLLLDHLLRSRSGSVTND